MLPTIDEALKELEIAGRMNPGPWVGHSKNTGLAAGNIAEKVPGMDPIYSGSSDTKALDSSG